MGKNIDKDLVDQIVEQWKKQCPELDFSSTSLTTRFILTGDYFAKRIDHLLLSFDLNLGEFNVLAALKRSGPPFELTPKQIQNTVLISPGALTNRITQLEKKELITRTLSLQDRRSILVKLTDSGIAKTNESLSEVLKMEKRLIEKLSQDEQASLIQKIKKLNKP